MEGQLQRLEHQYIALANVLDVLYGHWLLTKSIRLEKLRINLCLNQIPLGDARILSIGLRSWLLQLGFGLPFSCVKLIKNLDKVSMSVEVVAVSLPLGLSGLAALCRGS